MCWHPSAFEHGIFSVTHKLHFLTLDILLKVADVLPLGDGTGMLVKKILIVSVCLLHRDVCLIGKEVTNLDQPPAHIPVNTLTRLGSVEGKLLKELSRLAGILGSCHLIQSVV